MGKWVWLGWALKDAAWASSSCALEFNHDQLLVVKSTEATLVVDTGASNSVVFEEGGKQRSRPISSASKKVQYQEISVEANESDRKIQLVCWPKPVEIGNVLVSTGGLGGPMNVEGILGLGRAHTTPWTSFSVQVPADAGETGTLILTTSHLRPVPPSNLLPLCSHDYWATTLVGLKIGAQPIVLPGGPTAVVFDTGSNFFGLSSALFKVVSIDLSGCPAPTLTVILAGGVELVYESSSYSEDPECGSLAVGEIDQKSLGDLAHGEVFVVGTRGLRGKTLSIFKSAKSEFGFVMAVN